MEFQLSYFKSLKLCCESVAFNMPANLENSAGATGLEKFSVQSSNHHTISLISHTSKVMLKILQGRLQQYMSQELPDIQARFRKGRGIGDQIVSIRWITEKAREFHKNIYFCFIDCAKAFVWITINCGKFFKRWEYQTTLPVS